MVGVVLGFDAASWLGTACRQVLKSRKPLHLLPLPTRWRLLNVCSLPAPLPAGFPFIPFRGAINPTDPFDPSKWDRSDPMARWGGECRESRS